MGDIASMKSLITIWVLAGLSILGFVWYSGRVISQLTAQMPSDGLYFYHNGDLRMGASELYTINGDKVQLQVTADSSVLQVSDNPMQDMDMDSRKLQGSL